MTSPVVLYLCGSFNPLTNMHLRMFEIARDHLHRHGFRVLTGIISPVNDRYGKTGLLPIVHRRAMVEASLNSVYTFEKRWIFLDSWESEQPQWTPTWEVVQNLRRSLQTPIPSYTWVQHTLKQLKQLENHVPPQKVLFKMLCGADVLESFSVPKLWREDHMLNLVQHDGIVCVQRQGHDATKFVYEVDFLHENQANIHLLTEWISNDISSTRVRRALKRGDSVKFVVPDAVIEYAERNELYRPQKPQEPEPESQK